MQIMDTKESSRIVLPVRVMHLARERKWPGYGPASRSPRPAASIHAMEYNSKQHIPCFS
jgi:hypothetical protein